MLKPYHIRQNVITIADKITLNKADFLFRYSRSAGPGGQNVNKLNTRVTLFFDVAGCTGLTDDQKELVLRRLSTRTDKNGVVRVVSQKFRSQRANKQAAIERLCELLAAALRKKPVRIKTKVPRSASQKRLDAKERRGRLKQMRRPVGTEQ